MKADQLFMVFDAESIGLHGEGFAVGWVLMDRKGQHLEDGYAACPPNKAAGGAADRKWISEHIVPALPPPTLAHPAQVRSTFWNKWVKYRSKGAVLVADVPWPVEARFLAACIDDDLARIREAPYPLIDVASVRLAAGMDPLESRPRFFDDERPEHHPTADVHHSARLFHEALLDLEAFKNGYDFMCRGVVEQRDTLDDFLGWMRACTVNVPGVHLPGGPFMNKPMEIVPPKRRQDTE